MEPKEYVKNLGRDGAYVEYDVRQLHKLIATVKENKPFPKMLVLRVGRLELSDASHIGQLEAWLKRLLSSHEIDGMNDEQVGFYVFRQIFEEGLKSIDRKMQTV
jgi:hypothetical protein